MFIRVDYVGRRAGFLSQPNGGTDNVIVGDEAGFENEGDANVMVGTEAGFVNQGHQNTF